MTNKKTASSRPTPLDFHRYICRLVRQVSEIHRLEQITILDQTSATSCGR